MPSIITEIRIINQLNGKMITEALEGVDPADLETMQTIILDLPLYFVGISGESQPANKLVTYKCRVVSFRPFAEQPNCPRGELTIIPLERLN